MTTIKATPGTSVKISGASFGRDSTVAAYERTEHLRPVQPVEVHMICSDCQGEYLPTGMVMTCDPPLHVHACNGCGKVANLVESYPLIRWEDVK